MAINTCLNVKMDNKEVTCTGKVTAYNKNAELTSTGVSGAVIDPIRPIIDEKASRLCLNSVGYSSEVYRYSDVITIEIPNLPNRKITSRNTVRSETKQIAWLVD